MGRHFISVLFWGVLDCFPFVGGCRQYVIGLGLCWCVV